MKIYELKTFVLKMNLQKYIRTDVISSIYYFYKLYNIIKSI